MYTPQVDISRLFKSSSTMISSLPLDKPRRFSLDTSGVASLLGGANALSSMAALHVYGNRRWLGWYNAPGSYQISELLNTFAKSASFHTIFSRNLPPESVHIDPATLFQSRDSKGPKFRAAHSGTVIEETSYLAALFMRECTAWGSEGRVVPGRKTQPIRITIAKLGQLAPAAEMLPASGSASDLLFACIPIAVSLGTCVLCAVCEDWYAFSLILVGIIASGVSCLILGSADFMFTHPEPAKGSPAGDGILGSDRDIILLKGTEDAVNSVTRGKFSLRFSSIAHLSLVRWCSILFFIQSIAQLLFIPQASLFGQVMFVTSLAVSGLYNALVSSSDKERADRKMLFGRILENPSLSRYTLGTRTGAVVFMLLALRPQDPAKLLNELLPNDTKVWEQWKAMVLAELQHSNDQFLFEGKLEVGYLDGFTQQEQDLLALLYADARAAYNGYRDYLGFDSL